MNNDILERNRHIYANSSRCIPISFYKNPEALPFYPTGIGVLDCHSDYYIKRRHESGFTFIYILEGKTKLLCNGSRHILKKNDMALISLNRYHEYSSSDNNTFRYLFVNFTTNSSGASMLNLFNDFIGIPATCTDPHKTEELFDRLSAVALEPGTEMELVPYSCLASILSQFYHDSLLNKTHTGNIPPWCTDVTSYLETNYAEKVNFEELAEKYAGTSYPHFSRCFKNATGSSPSGYLNNIRLSHAKELLLSSTFPIEIIAFKTGFSNPSRFIDAFKKQNNITPHKFRTYKKSFRFPKKPIHTDISNIKKST